ncbi:AAC(3) family N-acetyltransferase [uncultured Mailhella sp.]|uniref:AAC(3) family N-acetyltransferase n=1 Tax=uncultured Mailhella sp. TaxID=1981031 RepID=UPI002620248B|nr:AAC(3) family N-acetyltransferase [uncultured Mailhella sp.]
MNPVLFHSSMGDVTSQHMASALQKVGAGDCDVLYIHTDMNFGLPALKRKELLAELLNSIESLGVRTLVFPTFTFSFCNNEVFDVQNSPTPMGALNEYVRKSNKGVRSKDPLLSVYVLGDTLNLIDNLSIYSIGENSNYDRLHTCGKCVKFLFFGADMRQCFTYKHYMEAVMEVPYRYNREFYGTIIDNGIEYKNKKAILYSRYLNCELNPVPVFYDEMNKKNMLAVENIGNSKLYCFYEKDAYKIIYDLLKNNPCTFINGEFDESKKDMRYNINHERIVSVK